jgi:hypothetical protein
MDPSMKVSESARVHAACCLLAASRNLQPYVVRFREITTQLWNPCAGLIYGLPVPNSLLSSTVSAHRNGSVLFNWLAARTPVMRLGL